jgi:hypothetical protein
VLNPADSSGRSSRNQKHFGWMKNQHPPDIFGKFKSVAFGNIPVDEVPSAGLSERLFSSGRW